jgi:hypothetical protein
MCDVFVRRPAICPPASIASWMFSGRVTFGALDAFGSSTFTA